jgi:hypothetical protein
MRSTIRKNRGIAAAVVSLFSAGFLVLSLGGCAETAYVGTYHAPESRYNTYYAPDYYPYYPWYSYYGGAYYSEY